MSRDAEEDESSNEALLALLLLIGKRARKYFVQARTELASTRTRKERIAWRRKWEGVASPEVPPAQEIDSRIVVAALAAYFWRAQKRMWTPAKRDLEARLASALPGQNSLVVRSWSAQWRAAARANAPEMRINATEILTRASKTLQKQIDRQLVDTGYTPRPIAPKTAKIAEIAVNAELGRFENSIGTLERTAERADVLNQGPEAVLQELETAGPKKAGSANNARRTSGMVLSSTQAAAFEAAGVVEARWVTQQDNKVRPTHRARHGRSFDVKKGLDGIWPGQEPECFVAETPTGVYGDLRAITTRLWSGPLAGIHTAEGFRLRGTPNHPVLTVRGWVALGDLHRGDQVFRVVDPQACVTHNQQGEVAIGHRLESLRRENGRTRRVPRGHFHGDASDNEVEVIEPRHPATTPVGTARELVGNVIPDTCPQLAELNLARSDGDTERERAERATLAAVRTAGRIMRGLDLAGASLRAHSAPFEDFGLALRPDGDPSVDQMSGDDGTRDADLLAQLQEAVTAGVLRLDPVKEIWWEDHAWVRVHNMETSAAAYSASTIIVHNCRCFGVPLPPATTSTPLVFGEAAPGVIEAGIYRGPRPS